MSAHNPYDAVPYSNHPYAQTHPDRLATVAVLHGLQPPDPSSARVLELGCGEGGNLLAMATGMPRMHGVGIDFAAAPIARGQATLDDIGLTNVELLRGDVRELTDGRLGTFDYVIAHGLYSWVPGDVREATLAIAERSLTPDGLAYVSFNANPGGYFRRMLRDVGLWHARAESSELEKAASAKRLYEFLNEQRVTSADTYGALLAREVPPVAQATLSHLVHDDLGEFWDALWFHQFAADAARHGLQFVGEADLSGLRGDMLPEGVDEQVWELARGDRVAFETYSDLLTARHFRQSVLCRAGAAVEHAPRPEHATRLRWSIRPEGEPLEVGLLSDAFAELDRRRPHAVPFEELREALGADPLALGEALLDGFQRERVYPHAGPLLAQRDPGEQPVASPLARWQAERQADLTSLAYQTVRMEQAPARTLVTLLDGSRTRAQIRAELAARTGLELSAEDLDRNLQELARLFLLM